MQDVGEIAGRVLILAAGSVIAFLGVMFLIWLALALLVGGDAAEKLLNEHHKRIIGVGVALVAIIMVVDLSANGFT